MTAPALSPRWRALLPRVELYLLLLAAFALALFGLYSLTRENYNFLLPVAGGLGALLLALIGGTRACLPLYFLSTFGTVLAFGFLPFSLNRLLAGLLFLAWILEIPRAARRVALSTPLVVLAVYTAYFMGMAAWLRPPGAPYPTETFFYMLMGVIVAAHYQSVAWQKWLFAALVGASLVMTVIPGALELATGIDYTLKGPGGPLLRLNGFSINAIFFAFCCLYAIPLAGALLTSTRLTSRRVIFGGAMLLLVFFALATLNRQTPIVLAAMAAVFIPLARFDGKRRLIISLFVVMALLAPFLGTRIAQRFTTTTDIRRDPSLTVRYDKALIATRMVDQHFWLGIGHSYYKDIWWDYRPKGEMLLLQYLWRRPQYIDLGYLQVLTEHGAIGFMLFLALLAASAVYITKYYRVSRQLEDPWCTNALAAVAALFVQIIVSMLIMDCLITPRTYLQFGIMLAVGATTRAAWLRQHAAEVESR